MSKIASFLSGNAVVVGGAAAAVVAIAVLASGIFQSPDPQTSVPDSTPAAMAPENTPENTPESAQESAQESALAGSTSETTEPAASSDAEPETTTATADDSTTEQTAGTDATSSASVPAFDVVRIEPSGRTLVAGNAGPNVDIAILLEGQEIATTTTDASGKFVSFLNIEPSDTARVMSLVQKGAGGVASEETVIISATPVASASASASASETTTAQDTTAEDSTAEGTSTETPTTTETAAIPAPVTTTVLLKKPDGVTVLQSPNEVGPDVMSSVALDAISYSDAGDVQLSGRSDQTGFVRVYLDNTPVTTSRIEEDGNWRMELPDVDTGVYTLRVDEVKDDGTVVSRVETPFKREDQEALAAVTEQATSAAQVITVQPGSSLWAIADERYGNGVMYVRVFEVNRERIRNPDLIYPGQIFALPAN